jgi:glutaredoxin
MNEAALSMAPDVTVSTRPGCSHCRLVKENLDERQVRFQERDMTQDQAAARELEQLHIPGLPVTVIDREAVLGFDRYRLDDLLKARGIKVGEPS